MSPKQMLTEHICDTFIGKTILSSLKLLNLEIKIQEHSYESIL